MDRRAVYSVEEVLKWVGRSAPRADLGGLKTDVSSLRLQTFKCSGPACVGCGIRGSFFAQERHWDTARRNGPYHLNLYAVLDGEEVLMTKDHVVPLSKGGPNHLTNLQTMCCRCNGKKGDKEVLDAQG